MNQEFQRAVERVNKLGYTPDNDVLLELYGLYKQSTVGDNNTDKPSWYDMKGSAKWQAWMKVFGMPSTVAMTKYVALANTL